MTLIKVSKGLSIYPLVLNSMVQMAWGGVDGKLIRTLSPFKRWLTLGVPASPFFKIRNLIRDTVHSLAVGKLKYNMFGNAAKGYDALKNDALVSAEMMMGARTPAPAVPLRNTAVINVVVTAWPL